MTTTLPGQKTLGDLKTAVDAAAASLTLDTPLFWYLGGDSFSIQAEMGGKTATVVAVKIEIAAGGPA